MEPSEKGTNYTGPGESTPGYNSPPDSPVDSFSRSQSSVFDDDGHWKSYASVFTDNTREEPWKTMPHGANTAKKSAKAGGNNCSGANYESLGQPIWPPPGFNENDELDWDEASSFFMHGTAKYDGRLIDLPHQRADTQGYFVMPDTEAVPKVELELPTDSTIILSDIPRKEYQSWWTIEYPSSIDAKGVEAGTITMNYWAGLSFPNEEESIKVVSFTEARRLSEFEVRERLESLEKDGPRLDDAKLYGHLLETPLKPRPSEKCMLTQIQDLIGCLNGPRWNDFSKYENHFITRNIAKLDSEEILTQVLLGMELHSRLEALSKSLSDTDFQRAIDRMPKKVTWNIIMAKRFFQTVRPRRGPSYHGFRFYFLELQRQMALLKEFAKLIKWPEMKRITEGIPDLEPWKVVAHDKFVGHDGQAWALGLLLPGPSSSWILMNTLLAFSKEIDDHPELLDLDFRHANTGFQLYGFTYWYSGGVVGKVLAALNGVKETAGWITACPAAFVLSKTKRFHIYCQEIVHEFTADEVWNMVYRTAPLKSITSDTMVGPCRVGDYHLPQHSKTSHCDIRFQELMLTNRAADDENSPCLQDFGFKDPYVHLAAISFAVGSEIVNLSLRYNVSFIAAYACKYGPHPIDETSYPYQMIDAHFIHTVGQWGHADADEDYPISPDQKNARPNKSAVQMRPKKVLVIEVWTADAQVLARAWCANLGLSAVIARTWVTCISCAIRGAYAANVSVVIMVGSYPIDEDQEERDAWAKWAMAEPAFNKPPPEEDLDFNLCPEL